MLRLFIFAIIMLALSGLCNGQGRTSFGAGRTQDTSFTKAQVKLEAYAGSGDTTILVLMPNGDVKKVSKNAFSGGGSTYTGGYGIDITGTVVSVDTVDFDARYLQLSDTAGMLAGYQKKLTTLFAYDFGVYPDDTIDDTRGINAMFDSAVALYGAKLFFPKGRGIAPYLIGDTLQKQKNGYPCNGQLVIPHVGRVQTGAPAFVTIEIEGELAPWTIDSYVPAALGLPDEYKLVKGVTTFKSTINNDGSGYPCLLSVARGDSLIPWQWVNHLFVKIKNMAFQVHYDSSLGGAQLCGVDLDQAVSQITENARFCLDTASVLSTVKSHNLFGFRGSHLFGMTNEIRSSAAMGFKSGIAMGEHGNVYEVNVFNCDYALAVQHNFQGLLIENLVPHACKWTFGAGIVDSGRARINGFYHAEKVNFGQGASLGDLYDPNNLLQGQLEFINFRNNGDYERTFIRNGGRNIIAKAVDSARIYLYGSSTYGGIYTDSMNHVMTNGTMTGSATSSSALTRLWSGTLSAGYTGSGRSEVAFFNNQTAGTGTNINGAAHNSGIAAGAGALTAGLNVGGRFSGGSSTVWNIGALGVATTNNNGDNMGVFGTALASLGGTDIGVAAYAGQPTGKPGGLVSSAIWASNGGTTYPIFVAADNTTRVWSILDGGAMVLGAETTANSRFDVNSSANSSQGMRVYNASNGTTARAHYDMVNDANDIFRLSLVSSGFTPSVGINPRDAVIGYGGGGNTVISNTSNSIRFVTAGTQRMEIVNGGTLSLAGRLGSYDGAAPTNGQLLIGNGTNFQKATITAGTGISITNGAGSVTIANTRAEFDVSETAITSTGGLSLTAYHTTRLIDATSGNITLTITPAAAGQIVNLKRLDATGNTVTIQMASGTIDGAASYSLTGGNTNIPIQWLGTLAKIL